ncbi:hypothetical protein SDRG_14753 [Saprolegnia diclina VS20]|uniref:Nodulin-like domain-containing protein n=1 Tax=Saprolegnia diclina (strain VS20) TaxID=1156394 RepID=T0RCZ1_SAPDV|nr:hypothetical protein SDRG_14753 [Saprolegnia diclina VS20]EQC27427.1 hypothetical protein SDRG_14753 [Saprolegnia diclina VS20]|eukprot:XP_008619127.1 hypothetical protein SDRG_14753 [Saprolegnia diclina VS20]
MFGWFRDYWRIVVPPKAPSEVDAERWLLVCPLPGERYGSCQCRPFFRYFILLAAIASQFVCGVLFALSTVSKPFDFDAFGGHDQGRNMALGILSGICVALTTAFVGPASERNGPRWSTLLGAGFVALGLLLVQLALWTLTWSPLVLGSVSLGLAFGYLMVSSISTVQKWYPDARGFAMGASMAGFGAGQIAWNELSAYADDHMDDSVASKNVFLLTLVVLSPLLGYCVLAMRTPPATFRVNGHDMHGIPSDAVLSAERIQGDYLDFGMTLVNYTAVTKPRADAAAPGTERAYYEHVRGLTLVQCIFSTDFVCLVLAFAANTTMALLYVEIATPSLDGLLTSWYNVSLDEANAFILHADAVGLAGRFFCPILSDVLLRALYLNPAYARKLMMLLLLLVPAIALPLLHSELDDFGQLKTLIFIVKVCSGGGFAVIGCFLTDLYGVYNMGTMYGLILMSWSLGMVIVGLVFSGLKRDFVDQVRLMWILSLAGFVFMALVRTDNMDRFYHGYQYSICGKIIIQRPYKKSKNVRQSVASIARSTPTPVGGIAPPEVPRTRYEEPFFLVSSDSETSYVV